MLSLVLGEIDGCKGILYTLLGINARVVDKLQDGVIVSFGKSLLSQAKSISEIVLEQNFSRHNLSVEQLRPFREISSNIPVDKNNQMLKRGRYTKTSQEQKNKIVNHALKSGNLSRTANIFEISQKNIKRWIDKVKAEYSTDYIDIEK